ncbi:hypothetical protein EB155_01455 [archaeon]|nr:hypothetical protein [archaeon]
MAGKLITEEIEVLGSISVQNSITVYNPDANTTTALIVDTIQANKFKGQDGSVYINQDVRNEYGFRPGQIIEHVASQCDGSTINSYSGDWTVENVTGALGLGTGYVNLTGSLINYKPPTGTTLVKYQFNFQTRWIDAHAILHTRFYIDGTEIIYARSTTASQYEEGLRSFIWYIRITGTQNNNTGTVVDWTIPKELKMMIREYGGSDEMNVHQTQYWDGGGSDIFHQPSISLTAYA